MTKAKCTNKKRELVRFKKFVGFSNSHRFEQYW